MSRKRIAKAPPVTGTTGIVGSGNALTGNPDSRQNLDIITSHWANDLCQKYAEISEDTFCRTEIIRQIHRNSAASNIVIDSISDTISSMEWNVIPMDDSEYWRRMAKVSKNELLQSFSRATGWHQFVREFVEDYLVSPTGHFTQLAYDGNGMPYQLGSISGNNPRPYYSVADEIFWDSDIAFSMGSWAKSAPSVSLSKRERVLFDGIWWSDGGLVYRLPKEYYYQSVQSARGYGAFLVGMSKAEKARQRIWLSATLEEYLQRVASGTDQSGLLIMNNLAYQSLANELDKRKEARKQPKPATQDVGNILYTYNIGEKEGNAQWVSFRPFPDGMDIVQLIEVSEEMVAAGYGIKSWRLSPSGDNGSGKFGNAKKAVQIDAQEPGVQDVCSAIKGMLNNVFFKRMPLQFNWIGGTSAQDSIRLDNATKLSQAITQSPWLSNDEMRAYAVELGFPKNILESDSGIASSSEGITKTGNNIVTGIMSGVNPVFDEIGLNEDRLAILTDTIFAHAMSRKLAKNNHPIGSERWRIEKLAAERDIQAGVKRIVDTAKEYTPLAHPELAFSREVYNIATELLK